MDDVDLLRFKHCRHVDVVGVGERWWWWGGNDEDVLLLVKVLNSRTKDEVKS